MKRAELTYLAKRVSAQVPNTIAWREMVLFPPLTPVLRGVLLEPSGDPRGLYANAFFQPLYVPSERVALNLGWRLGGGAHVWRMDSRDAEAELAWAISSEVAPKLSKLKSPGDVVEASRPFAGDGYAREAIAYSFARLGNVQQASECLTEITNGLDRAIPWQRRAVERAERLAALLLTDEVRARSLLDEWESETARSLELPQIGNPA